jgi:hypothetical protein
VILGSRRLSPTRSNRANANIAYTNGMRGLSCPTPRSCRDAAIPPITARQANTLLARTGHPFWQYETYNHLIRNSDELNRVIRYIEGNPVRAGLTTRIEDGPGPVQEQANGLLPTGVRWVIKCPDPTEPASAAGANRMELPVAISPV